MQDQAQTYLNEREAQNRAADAERAADEYAALESPSAREKFFQENPNLVNSKRFNAINAYQKAQPSYADRTLQNTIAQKYQDPAVRNAFLDAVAQGKGTLAARDIADNLAINQKWSRELSEAGIPPEEHAPILAKGPEHAAYAISQKKQDSIFHSDPEARAMERYHSIVKSRAARDMQDMSNPNFGTVRPETQAELDQIERMLAAKYKNVFGGAASATSSTSTPATVPFRPGVTPTAPAAATKSPTEVALRDTLKSMSSPAASPATPAPVTTPSATAPAAPASPTTPVATPEQIKSAQDEFENSPEADENYYSARIADPNTPLEKKQELLQKFRAYAQNPKPDPSLTLQEVFARKEALKKQLAEAEDEVKFQPERQKFNQAWSSSKGRIDQMVDRFAARMGVPKQNVINSLIAGDHIDIPGRTNRGEAGVSIPQLLAEDWMADNPDEASRMGLTGAHQLWGAEAPELTPFKSSSFAGRLGTKIGPVPVRQTFGDVLDAYVADQKNTRPSAPMASRPATNPTANPAGIKSIKLIP